jgi:hypothetical protein
MLPDQWGQRPWESRGYATREEMEQEDRELIQFARERNLELPDYIDLEANLEHHHEFFDDLSNPARDAFMQDDLTPAELFNHHMERTVAQRQPVEENLDGFTRQPFLLSHVVPRGLTDAREGIGRDREYWDHEEEQVSEVPEDQRYGPSYWIDEQGRIHLRGG